MESVQECVNASTTMLDCRSAQGLIQIVSKTLFVKSDQQTDLINLSEEIRGFVEMSGIEDGYVQVSSLHTTAGLFINEWQDALLADVKMTLDRLVPLTLYYKHNDPDYSDCDRKNAHSHLRNAIVGHSLTIPIAQSALVLGRWQHVIMAEFDGPNERRLFLQALGILG